MLNDRELWGCANEVLRQHGEAAKVHVAERIGALVLAGDAAGVATWKSIAQRLETLTADGRRLDRDGNESRC